MEDILKRNQRMAEALGEVLLPAGHLVAVKLLKSLDGMEQVKRPDTRVFLCPLLSQVRYFGRTRLVDCESCYCYAARWWFGFEEQTEEDRVAMAKRYTGWQKGSEEAARGTQDKIPRFPYGEYKGILLAALERCPVAPDVVVFFGNASQMFVIVGGYLRNRGEFLTFRASEFGACAQAIILPMVEKKPQIVIPSNALRLLAMPDNGELACGIPGELLEEMTENMRLQRERGGSRYPPAWQHIQWEAQSPISDMLKRDGVATWFHREGK